MGWVEIDFHHRPGHSQRYRESIKTKVAGKEGLDGGSRAGPQLVPQVLGEPPLAFFLLGELLLWGKKAHFSLEKGHLPLKWTHGSTETTVLSMQLCYLSVSAGLLFQDRRKDVTEKVAHSSLSLKIRREYAPAFQKYILGTKQTTRHLC